MSDHERERLSAWLDDELTAEQRAEVDGHLAGCAECRERLAELGAVDALAREQPLEVPVGYFEAFPGRLRARLEGAGRQTARPGWRPPVWTWAAAAALLLAVVTPLTLMRLGVDGTAPAFEPPRATTRQEAPMSNEVAAPEAPARLTPEEKDAPAFADDTRPPPAAEDRQVLEKGEATRERRLETTEPSEGVRQAAPRAAAPAVAAPEPDRAPEVQDLEGFAAPPASEEEAPAARSAVAPPGRPSARTDVAQPEATSPETVTESESAEAGARAKRAPEALGEALYLRGPVREEGPAEDEEAFARLAQESPEDAAGWRTLRQEWRAFVSAHSESPLADEARVRTIEAGLEAWRASGQDEDLARARADARAYLGRDDVEQAERVRRALESVENR